MEPQALRGVERLAFRVGRTSHDPNVHGRGSSDFEAAETDRRSLQVDRPLDDPAWLDLRLQLGRIESEERADLNAKGHGAVGPALDEGAGGFEPAGEEVAH